MEFNLNNLVQCAVFDSTQGVIHILSQITVIKNNFLLANNLIFLNFFFAHISHF